MKNTYRCERQKHNFRRNTEKYLGQAISFVGQRTSYMSSALTSLPPLFLCPPHSQTQELLFFVVDGGDWWWVMHAPECMRTYVRVCVRAPKQPTESIKLFLNVHVQGKPLGFTQPVRELFPGGNWFSLLAATDNLCVFLHPKVENWNFFHPH